MNKTEFTPEQALEVYSSTCWEPEDIIEIRALPTAQGEKPYPVSIFLTAKEIPKAFDRLKSMNKAGHNIYAGICPRRAEGGKTDADSRPGLAVWVDMDNIDPRDAWKRVRDAGLPSPTMVVASGHGCHMYWRLEERPSLDELPTLVRDLAVLVGGDQTVKNPSRVLRVPGFQNLKEPPQPCVLLFADPSIRFSFNELRDRVPRSNGVKPQSPTPNKFNGDRQSLIERARRYAAAVPGTFPGGRRDVTYKVAAAIHNDLTLTEEESFRIIRDWDSVANSPPITSDYGEEELVRIIQNTGKYHKNQPGILLNSTGSETAGRWPEVSIIQPGSDDSTSTLNDEIEAEGRGERKTVKLPWNRLHKKTQALRPGTVTVLAAPSGYGKSLFTLQIAVSIETQGQDIAYLPLEDRKVDFERRVLAHLSGNWGVTETERTGAKKRIRLLNEYEEELTELMRHVHEFPRTPVVGPGGHPTVPPLHYREALEWVTAVATFNRVVFIDPIAQIDFGPDREWRGQQDFMRSIAGIAAQTGASVVLVAHTIKRCGTAWRTTPTGEDIQGAAEIKRLSHTVILLDAHKGRQSEVLRPRRQRETVDHTHTVMIDKARNAGGRGLKLAFNLEDAAFTELGVIVPKGYQRV